MRRQRFLIEDLQVVKHMRLVLRLKKGDKIELFDGEGHEYLATLGFLSREQAAGVVDSLKENRLKQKPAIFLAQAMPRAGKLDTIVRMNTELGVQGFVLFDSEYSVTKRTAFPEDRVSRLERVAVEALRQSEGVILPDFYGPMSFAEALDFKADLKILLHSRDLPGVVELTKLKQELQGESLVIVFIGPEGGFSEKELQLAREKGVRLAYLDLPVLRTETAGLVTNALLLS